MSLKTKITAYDLIKNIMLEHPDTQCNDVQLYLYVMDYYKVPRTIAFSNFFSNEIYKKTKLPTYRTVTRTRLKVQRENPDVFEYKKQIHHNTNAVYITNPNDGTKTKISAMELIEKILREKPSSRENDFLLYGFVLNANNISCRNVAFETICENIENGNFPMFTTVDVCRRSLQRIYPGELEASFKTTIERGRQIPEYKKFNRLSEKQLYDFQN